MVLGVTGLWMCFASTLFLPVGDLMEQAMELQEQERLHVEAVRKITQEHQAEVCTLVFESSWLALMSN